MSEQKLVVVLFIMVIITFFFAQSDTNKIEKMYLKNNNPSVTTSLDEAGNRETGTETKRIKLIIPALHLR